MRAVVYSHPGPSTVLHIAEREIPTPKSNEVLIKVHAAGINRPDIFQRLGKYPAPNGVVQDIPGLEVSGTIEKTGKSVSDWEIGQEVMALVPGGGYAEYISVDSGSCLPVPQGVTLTDAASFPEVLFTVWHNIFQRGQLRKGEKVLIYGGSGGIGSMAIQLVNLYGAEAYTMSSTNEKADFCHSLGAREVVNYRNEDLVKAFGESKFDLILDSLGGQYFNANLKMLKSDGRLVYINAMEGVKPQLNILLLMQKRLHITGSTLRARTYDFKKSLRDDILQNAFPLLEKAKFKPTVKHKFSLEKAAEAHRLMESREFMGKIVLTI